MTDRGNAVQRCAAAALALCAVGAANESHAEVYTAYAAREHQPQIRWSGRVNAAAIDPSNAAHVLATSDTGGLWESFDGGVNWRHVDALPVFNLADVHFVSANPRIVLVSALPDFNLIRPDGGAFTTSGGGVWMTRDGGATWTQPTAAIPAFGRIAVVGDRSCPPRGGAYEIDEDRETGRIFVATTCGVSYTDDIASRESPSWTHKSFSRSLATPDTRRFAAVAALDGPYVVLGGGDGVWWSENNGEDWRRSDTDIKPVLDTHAASGVPGLPRAGFIVSIGADADRRLWRTNDGGRTWAEIPGDPPNGRGCGGIAQVYGFEVLYRLERTIGVYYGNACSTYRYLFASNPFSGLPWGAGDRFDESWERLPDSHGDTRALAFTPASLLATDLALLFGPEPKFLANDGGLDRLEGGRWTPIGSGPNRINALQLYDLEGQRVRETGAYRLAFGTQDNGLWSSSDETSWPQSQSTGPELGAIQMSKIVSEYDEEKWTYVTCGDCFVQTSDPLFQGQEIWPGYATKGAGWGFSGPRRVHPTALDGMFLQAVGPNRELREAGETLGLELAVDYGETYLRFHEPTEEIRGDMNINRGVVYQALVRGAFAESVYEGRLSYKDTELLRISGILSSRLRRIEYPAMNGFGSLGHYAFQFAWAPVFAVDPSDTRHLIAPDVQNRLMKASTDGGESWSTITGLAEQLTRGGRYDMALASPWSGFSFSLVSAISFFPDNPDLVVLGMQLGGAYISENGGRRWRYVEGSDRITNILDFDWKSADEIYVASYGRGLWKLESMGLAFDLIDLQNFLIGQRLDTPLLRNIEFGDLHFAGRGSASAMASQPSLQSFEPVPLAAALKTGAADTVVIAADGSITGLKPGKRLREQIVTTPGATLYYFAGDPKAIVSGKLRASIDKPVSLALEPKGAEELAAKLRLSAKPARDENRVALALMGATEDGTRNKSVIPPPKEEKQAGTPQKPAATVVGLALKGGDVAGLIVGSGATHRKGPETTDVFSPKPRQTPPRFDRGYVIVHSGAPVIFGGPVYPADHPVTIEGRGFSPGRTVTIEIDGKAVMGAHSADKDGTFLAAISLKDLAPGEHLIRVRQSLPNGGEDDDAAYIVVQHHDEGPEGSEERSKQGKPRQLKKRGQ